MQTNSDATLRTNTQSLQVMRELIRSRVQLLISKVLVAANDEIAIGQALFVIEAMKMENEVRAKRAGVVAEVFVVTGSTVENGGRLLSFA